MRRRNDKRRFMLRLGVQVIGDQQPVPVLWRGLDNRAHFVETIKTPQCRFAGPIADFLHGLAVFRLALAAYGFQLGESHARF